MTGAERSRLWRERHPERYRAVMLNGIAKRKRDAIPLTTDQLSASAKSSSQWRERHPDQRREIVRQSNLKQRKAKMAWASANREKVRAARRAWNERNPGATQRAVKAAMHRRRAQVRGTGGSFTADQWNALLAQFDFCCGYCGRGDVALEAEHRTPLVRGGTGAIDNIIPACRSCNLRKHTMTEPEFRAVLAG